MSLVEEEEACFKNGGLRLEHRIMGCEFQALGEIWRTCKSLVYDSYDWWFLVLAVRDEKFHHQ